MKVFIILLTFLFCSQVYGASPFMPHTEKRFQELEKQITQRFTYDVAVHTGTVAAHGLGVYLPPKAAMIRSFAYVDTAFTTGTGTVAISCEDSANIFSAFDPSTPSAGDFVEGNQTGAISAATAAIAARCEITATVGATAQTDGKLTGWVTYVLHD